MGSPADDGGLNIALYTIDWDTDASFGNLATSGYTADLVPSSSGPYHLNIALATSHAYYVRVRAKNAQGYGPYTTIAAPVAPAYGVPSAPASGTLTVVSEYELRVDWLAPDPDLNIYGGDGGLSITHYLIEWDVDFDSNPSPSFHIFSVTGGDSSFSYTIGNRNPLTGEVTSPLIAGETYEVRVAAYNSMGYGPYIDLSSATTSNQVPDAPASLSVSVASSTSLAASWTTPLSDGGSTIDLFKLQYDPSSTFSSLQTISITADSPLSADTGSFKVAFGSSETTCIKWDATPSQLESALESSIAEIYDVQVSSASNDQNGYDFTITFINPVAPAYTVSLANDQSSCESFGGGLNEQIAMSTTSLGEVDLPVHPEVQMVLTHSDVTIEVQEIAATVRVTNEQQTLTTSVTGIDEVVTITTDCDSVTAEIQRIETSTADIDEEQVVSIWATDVNEKQTITTSADHVDAVQRILLTGTDEDEVQVLELTDSRRGQDIVVSSGSAISSTNEVQTITLTEGRNTQVVTFSAVSALSQRSEVQTIRLYFTDVAWVGGVSNWYDTLTGQIELTMDSSASGSLFDDASSQVQVR